MAFVYIRAITCFENPCCIVCSRGCAGVVNKIQQNVLQLRNGAQWLKTFRFALCLQPAPGAKVLRGIRTLRCAQWLAVKAVARCFVYFLLSLWSSLFRVLEEAGCWNDWFQLMCAGESSLVISDCCGLLCNQINKGWNDHSALGKYDW